jgi:hypothetical protein
MAGASSNYAIDPSALVQQPYRVTVAVPALAGSGDCAIGRTGRVLFDGTALRSAPNRLLTAIRSFFE